MANNEFKTAAAKLLAQHSAKKKENGPAKTDQPQVNQAVPPAATTVNVYADDSKLSKSAKTQIIAALAAIGSAIMVFLVPETIFGMWFNVIFGIIAGTVMGFIFTWEL